jgi:hypothetical protein
MDDAVKLDDVSVLTYRELQRQLKMRDLPATGTALTAANRRIPSGTH